MKIAIISTYPDQKCGIATFSHDLYKSLLLSSDDTVHIIAVTDTCTDNFPKEVVYKIAKHKLKSYIKAADFINEYDLCIIQHEYGIFGGECGDYILQLTNLLHIPIITNFHTILPKPSTKEKEVLQAIGHISTMLTVMTNWAVNMLHSIYQIPTDKIQMIPHGVPVFDYKQDEAKKKLGLADRKILLSFGFLGRGKGFETAIEAVKDVKDPNFRYIILGITHPNVVREEGESYRELLMNQCKDYGIDNKVIFVNEFASDELLISYLTACDIYVTPYPNENQISSGTLTFALGAGSAVISTPYLYAKDLLSEERGLLFDFNNSMQLATHVNNLFENPDLLAKYRNNARVHGEKMQWPNIGRKYSRLAQSIYKSNKKLFKRA
ncbi:MAG: glycosyltransferase family 4 protein [Sphingobacterium composti]|uniref:glycosyltransferase family 4 protein n=1 Tax=Sphingobacterium composti TaxID=363260 RepID=UPI001359FD43|nr:glycosyltransferase family 4 protein [Sphingobacterium composti Ten et al. 2007 non Yoo et al. 2007]